MSNLGGQIAAIDFTLSVRSFRCGPRPAVGLTAEAAFVPTSRANPRHLAANRLSLIHHV